MDQRVKTVEISRSGFPGILRVPSDQNMDNLHVLERISAWELKQNRRTKAFAGADAEQTGRMKVGSDYQRCLSDDF